MIPAERLRKTLKKELCSESTTMNSVSSQHSWGSRTFTLDFAFPHREIYRGTVIPTADAARVMKTAATRRDFESDSIRQILSRTVLEKA